MNTKSTIQALIDQTKALPNSLERNKLVSHLENACLIAALMEYQTGDRFGVNPNATVVDLGHCSCPSGAIDNNCAFHGTKAG